MNCLLCFSVAVLFVQVSMEAQLSYPKDDDSSANLKLVCPEIPEEEDDKPGETMDADCLNEARKKIKEEKKQLKRQLLQCKNYLTRMDEIKKSNEQINIENNILKKNIKSVQNENQQLNQIINVLRKEINTKANEEGDGEIDQDGSNDIWDAAAKGSLIGVKYWHVQDASLINAKNSKDYKKTPLHYASRIGYLRIVKFLLSKGVDVEPLTTTNATPLMDASITGHFSIVLALLDKKAKINFQDNSKQTALHYAVEGDHLTTVKVLVERGSDKTIKNYLNDTPLEYAKRWGGRASIISYLESN